MKIWQLPDDGSRRNLYGVMLAEGLRGLGHQVRSVPYRHLFALPALAARPDVVHFQAITPFLLPANSDSGWRALLKGPLFLGQVVLLRGAGCRVVWTMHNLVNHERRLAAWEWFFSLLFTRLADVLIAHGEAARSRLAARYGLATPSLQVVPHPSYIGAYPDELSRAEARQRLGVAPDARMLLAFGMIRPYKGLLELSAAYRGLAGQERAGAELWIVGEAADARTLASLQQAASPGLRLRAGFVPEAQVQVYLRACDVVVLPYRAVLTSGAALLAMSFGRPCVAPRLPCLEELLDPSANLLYDPRAPGGLAGALRRALECSRLDAMGRRNRTQAEGLDVQRWLARLLELYGAARGTPACSSA